MKKTLTSLAAVCLLITGTLVAQSGPAAKSAGQFVATGYNQWRVPLYTGNSATGSSVITLNSGTVVLPGGSQIAPFSIGTPITVNDGSSTETVTPTAVSGCTFGALENTCLITASFSNLHGRGATASSGTAGLQEAINDAHITGGVVAVSDASVTNALLSAALVYHNVAIVDYRSGAAQFWNPMQSASTALATPATLTAVTMLPSATPVGAFGTGTYHGCISYVDIMGNEGTCSADFSEAGLATGSFIFSAPAASTGAVGYTIYISLTGGSYALSYKVPLTSSICTLTTIETVTAACAVANTAYGQSGSSATVTAITVNTAMLAPNATTISATTDYVPNPNARTAYAYVPSSRVGIPGVLSASLPFPVGAAAGSTVPDVIGTLTLPAGFMNFVGKTIEVCGYATEASAGSTATISNIQLWWDAAGSNAAGVPVLIGTIPSTNTLVTANTDQFSFCYDLKTTVAGAGVTAGSIQQTNGFYMNQYTTSSVATVPKTQLGQGPAAVGSLNLAGEARIEVVWLHTTNTDGAGVLLQDLTVKVLN